MYQPIQFKTTIPHSVSRLLLRRGLLLISLAFTFLALAPALRAVTPPPGGGYPGFNTALGDNALKVNDNTQGQFNTAIGFNALQANTTGDHNTAFGLNTLLFNTTGTGNMGVGGGCLRNNTTGGNNTSVGYQAMSANNTGSSNTAIGFHALNANTTGIRHVAIGYEALASNTTGTNASNAVGYRALFANTTGNFNNAFGWQALAAVTTGDGNTAMGDVAGFSITTGDNNTSLGADAGSSLTTGSGNVCIGQGVFGEAGVNDSTYIRNVWFTSQPFLAGTNDVVTVRADGRLGFAQNLAPSSRRYKHDIKPMDQSSEVLFRLKPVTFRYNKDFDPAERPRWGLVAEDVQEVNPDLIVRNREGKVDSVLWEAVYAMMLNEFLKEHSTVEQLKSTVARQEAIIAQQQKGMEVLTAQLKEQAAQIQKVSARLDVSKPAPKVAANQ
jgi:hypothetical protein